MSNREALVSIVKGIERSGLSGNKITGIPTGIDTYDRLTLGLHAKQLTVVAARPAAGKTSLGANIATNVALHDIGVLFFSLEMSKEEILFRILSSLSGIDGTKMKLGQLSTHQWGQIHQAAEKVHKSPLFIHDNTTMTMNDIAAVTMGAIDESVGKKPIGLIVIDYWQKIAIPRADEKKPRYLQLGDTAKGCKQLARDTGLPVILLAQLRRLADKDKNRRPTMDDLRESGEAEQEADNVTLLHYPDQDKENERRARQEAHVKELIIDKARSGRSGMVNVRWQPELTTFSNLPEEPGTW